MDTLKCIHNILTIGIFVLFCLICFLVNKCCCQSGPCGDHCVCLENENAVNIRVKDRDPKVRDKVFTLRANKPDNYIDIKIKSAEPGSKDQIISIQNTSIDSAVISPDISPDPSTNNVTGQQVQFRVKALDEDVPDKVYILRRRSFDALDNQMNIRIRSSETNLTDQLVTFRPKANDFFTPGRVAIMENDYIVPEVLVSLKIEPNNIEPSEIIISPGLGYNPEVMSLDVRLMCDIGVETICPEMFLQSIENKSLESLTKCQSCVLFQAKSYDSHGKINNFDSDGKVTSTYSTGPSCQNIDIQKILDENPSILSTQIKACNTCVNAEVQVSDESEEIVEHTVTVKVRVIDSNSQCNVQRRHEHMTPSGTKISITGPIRTEDCGSKKVRIGSPAKECVRECPRAPVVVQVPIPEYIRPCIYEEEICPFAYTAVPCEESDTPYLCPPRRYEEYRTVGRDIHFTPSKLMKDVCVEVSSKNLNCPSVAYRNCENEDRDICPAKDRVSISFTSASTESSKIPSEKVKFKFDRPYHSDIITKRKDRSEFYDEDTPKLKKETKRMYDELRTDVINKNQIYRSDDVSEDDSTNSDQFEDSGKFIDHKKDKITRDENYMPFKDGKCSGKCQHGKNKTKDKDFIPCKNLSSPCKGICCRDSKAAQIEESGYSPRERRHSAPTKRRKVCPGPALDVNNDSYRSERQVSDVDVVSVEGNVTEFPPVVEDVSSRLCAKKACGRPVRPRTPDSNSQNARRRSSCQRNKKSNDNSRRLIKTPPSTCGTPCVSQKEFIPVDEEVDRLYKKYGDNESYKSSPSSCGNDDCDCDDILRLMFEKYGTPTTTRSKGRGRETKSQQKTSLNNKKASPIGKNVSTTTSSSSTKKSKPEKKNKNNKSKNVFSTSSSSKQDSDTIPYSEESITPNERKDIGMSKYNSPKTTSSTSWIVEIADKKSATAVGIQVSDSKRKLEFGYCPPVCPKKRPYSTEESNNDEDDSLVFDDYDSGPVKKQKIDDVSKERLSNKQVVFDKKVQKLKINKSKYISSEESDTYSSDNKKNVERSCKSICKQIKDQIARECSEGDIGQIPPNAEEEIRCTVCARLLNIKTDRYDSKLRCQACIDAIRAEMNKTDTEKLSDSDILSNVLKSSENICPCEESICPCEQSICPSYKIEPIKDINSTKPIIKIRPRSCGGPCNCNNYRTKKVSSKITIMSKCNTSIEAFADNKEYLKNNKNPLVRITIDLEDPSVRTKTEGPDNQPRTPDNSDYDKLQDLPPDRPPKYYQNNQDNQGCDNCYCTDINPGESVLEYLNRMRRNNVIPYPACYESWSRTFSAPSSSSTVRTDEYIPAKIEEEEYYTSSSGEKTPVVGESEYSFSSISATETIEMLPPVVEEPENLKKYNVSFGTEKKKNNSQKKNKRPEKNVMKYFSDGPSTSGVTEYGKFYPYRNQSKRPMTEPQDTQPFLASCTTACKNYYTNTVPKYDMNGKYSVTTDQPHPQVRSIYKREIDSNSADHSSDGALSCPYMVCNPCSLPSQQNCHPKCDENTNSSTARVWYPV